MKKTIVSVALSLACLAGLQAGTVNFANVGVGVNSPVFNVDGTTALGGAGFQAQLWVIDGGSPTPAGDPTGFLAAGGFFNGGSIEVGFGAGPATLQVVAWDVASGATYADATIRGESNQFTIDVLGGQGNPPSTPAALVGLESFSLADIGGGDGTPVVPEPSTVALGILGAAVFFLRRRK